MAGMWYSSSLNCPRLLWTLHAWVEYPRSDGSSQGTSTYSPDGFMRTGQLALYRPTLKMDNYRLEFFTQIESKSVGWVFRAKNEQNYYAMKLSVTDPGPRPLVSYRKQSRLLGRAGECRFELTLRPEIESAFRFHVRLCGVEGAVDDCLSRSRRFRRRPIGTQLLSVASVCSIEDRGLL